MSRFKSYSSDELENLFSNYLVNSWSFSKLSSFARNEKAFEMVYIYGLYGKSSPTTVAGEAYHCALQYFFTQLKDGVQIDLVELEASAFAYLNGANANKWKLGKTTPTVEDCMAKATKVVSDLLRNFMSEVNTYIDDIAEVLHVELYGSEFLTVNGVDLPLPCNFKIDLIVRTKAGKTAVIDHKSKASYTSDDEIALAIGSQAITYVLGYEAKTGESVDQVWFIENKYSQNKDKSPQLNAFKLDIDADTRRLYEALLYEPLRRMISAVSDPDYIYLINDSDNYTDRAELYEFWARTMISEVEDFNVEETKKQLVSQRLKKVRDASIRTINPNVIKHFRENASQFIQYDLSSKNMTQEEKIEHVLRSFGTLVKVAHKFIGYSSNTFLLEVSAGVKISSIHQRRLDIANALDVASVRLSKDLVVHEGKSYLAVDFTSKSDRILYFNPDALKGRRIPLGRDNYDKEVVWDLDNHSTPHMLVCGATGSGKSVLVKDIIEYGILAKMERIVILDPKFEFGSYSQHSSIEVYNDILEIEEVMKDLVDEMQDKVKRGLKTSALVIFDEFADAMANSRKGSALDEYEMVQVGEYAPKMGAFGFLEAGRPKMQRQKVGELKSLEENLRVLLQKGRSIGYRIVAATQRASVKVITGDAKVNFPVQVCFRVPKEADSRVVLDEAGAESLAGMGDGLIKSPEYKDVVRFQAYYKPDAVTA